MTPAAAAINATAFSAHLQQPYRGLSGSRSCRTRSSALAGIITGSLAVAQVRDALTDAERRLQLFAWHLRELVPIAARAAGDSVASLRRGDSGRR